MSKLDIIPFLTMTDTVMTLVICLVKEDASKLKNFCHHFRFVERCLKENFFFDFDFSPGENCQCSQLNTVFNWEHLSNQEYIPSRTIEQNPIERQNNDLTWKIIQ